MARGWNGEPHPGRKLTDDQVREVFTLYRDGRTMREIGVHIGTPASTVRNILIRKNYKDVEVPFDVRIRSKSELLKGRPKESRSFTDDQVREIRRLAREGVTQTRIAEIMHARPTRISNIVRRAIYKDVADLPETPAAS